MGTTDYGTQTLGFAYNQEATSEEFNGVYYNVIPTGIYTGFSLAYVDDTTVTVGTGTCIISDTDSEVSVKVATEATYDITVAYTTPYIVFRFTWSDSSTNYMDMYAVAYADIEDSDIIVGRCIFDDDTTTLQETFDYNRKSTVYSVNLETKNEYLRVYPSEPADEYVYITYGVVNTSTGLKTITAGYYPTSGFSDTTNGRTDLLYVDEDGEIQVLEGVDASSPTTPDYKNRKVIAEITRGSGETSVKGNEITRVITSFDSMLQTSALTITDSGSYYASENVEDALQEIVSSEFTFDGAKTFEDITVTAQDGTVAETITGDASENIQELINYSDVTAQYVDSTGKLYNSIGTSLVMTDTYGNFDTNKVADALNQISGGDMSIDGIKTFNDSPIGITVSDSTDSTTKVATTAFVQSVEINSFDQESNTTDNVIYNNVTIDGSLDVGGGIDTIRKVIQHVPLLCTALGVEYCGYKSVSTVTVGDSPYEGCFDGTYIWVANTSSDTVSKINATSNSVETTISVGNSPLGVGSSGTYIWVSNSNDDTVSKIDPDTDTVDSTISVGDAPRGICFDGTYIWVCNYNDDTVSKIDPDTDTVDSTISVGTSPNKCCFDGTYIWVANLSDDTVSKIDTDTDTVDSTITVGDGPFGCCFDGTYIWVSNSKDNTVSKINATSNSIISTITVGSGPHGICFDGSHIWVTNLSANTVSKINATSNSVVSTISVGSNPYDTCFDGTYVWITNYADDNVQKILT